MDPLTSLIRQSSKTWLDLILFATSQGLKDSRDTEGLKAGMTFIHRSSHTHVL